MQSRMDLFYANRDVQYRYQVDEPAEGMLCAVRVPGPDGVTFKRGRVEQVVPHTRLAQVMMPDTGHRLVVGTRDLFVLSQDDFVTPCPYALSLPVSLSNIKPIKPWLGWGKDATRLIQDYVGYTLAMHVCPDVVEDSAPSDQEETLPNLEPPCSGLPTVALFHSAESSSDLFICCLNAQLVVKNLCQVANEAACDNISVPDADEETDEPIKNMLNGCARNKCLHPLTFDRPDGHPGPILDWMVDEWKDD